MSFIWRHRCCVAKRKGPHSDANHGPRYVYTMITLCFNRLGINFMADSSHCYETAFFKPNYAYSFYESRLWYYYFSEARGRVYIRFMVLWILYARLK